MSKQQQYTPEIMRQSKQWTTVGAIASKKPKAMPSAGKDALSVFWKTELNIKIEFLRKEINQLNAAVKLQ